MADDRVRANLMDVKTAADFLGMSPLEIRRLITDGAIPVVMVGPFVRFDRDTIDAWQRQPTDDRPRRANRRH